MNPRVPPLISIVTPSFNQGRFIEETIRSVLSQGYSRLEYIVCDGGSTDDTASVLDRYIAELAYCVSEPDFGQAHAINKGFAHANGDVLGWINSDDLLLPGALLQIADAFVPECDVLYAGPVREFDDRGMVRLVGQDALDFANLVRFWRRRGEWHQPGVFFSRSLWRACGPLDESLHYAMDYDFMCKALQRARVVPLASTVAAFRRHEASKTCSAAHGFYAEALAVSRRYWTAVPVQDVRRAYLHTTLRLGSAFVRRLATGSRRDLLSLARQIAATATGAIRGA